MSYDIGNDNYDAILNKIRSLMLGELSLIKPGTKLKDGRYDVLSELGMGTRKKSFPGFDNTLNRKVVVKVLLQNEHGAKELIEEAKTQAKIGLGSQYAATVYDADFDHKENVYYVVEEYVEGKTLEAFLRELALTKTDWLSQETALKIIEQTLEALEKAHERNYCHGDVKPANIMVRMVDREVQEVKLIDWGVARHLGRDTMEIGPKPKGSITFAPPEVLSDSASNRYPDAQSDLFSLGILAYLLLTETHPFVHPTGLFNSTELVSEEKAYSPSPPESDASGKTVPQVVQKVIMKLLEKKRDENEDAKERDGCRYKTARSALDDLTKRELRECAACGYKNSPTNKFCGNCGEDLSETPRFNDPEEAYEAARSRGDLGEWNQAIAVLEAHLDLFRERSYAWGLSYLAYLYNDKSIRRYEEAQTIATEAIKLSSNVPSPKRAGGLARAYAVRAFSNRRQGNLSVAIGDYSEALGNEFDNDRKSDLLVQRADVYLLLEELDKACKDCRDALKLNPANERATFLSKVACKTAT